MRRSLSIALLGATGLLFAPASSGLPSRVGASSARLTVTLSYVVVAPGESLSRGRVAVGSRVELTAKVSPGIPDGAHLVILDKPQGATTAPKSGYQIRACRQLPCSVTRVETDDPRTHAYRAFVIVGRIGRWDLHVLGSSPGVAIAWVEPPVTVDLRVQTTSRGVFERSARVKTGSRVTLWADVEEKLPVGTRVEIFHLQSGKKAPDPRYPGVPFRTCTTEPCTAPRTWPSPATFLFRAVVYRGHRRSNNEKVLARSAPVTVTWAGDACTDNWWHGTWGRQEHAGEITFIQSGRTIASATYTWFGGGAVANMVLSSDCRTMTGEGTQTATLAPTFFEIRLVSQTYFTGNWRWATTPAGTWNGSFSGRKATP